MFFNIRLVFLIFGINEVLGTRALEKKTLRENNFLIDRENSIEVGTLEDHNEISLFRKVSDPFVVSIPPAKDGAKVARYIVRNSEWGSLASISTVEDVEGFPFTDAYSFSDGPLENATGVPYFYVTPLDLTAINIEKDSRCSLSLTLAEGHYCVENNFDPEDPRCAHVVLTGSIVKVKAGTDEERFAESALFSRHPAMKTWPKDHNWFFAKLEIKKICLLDYFGGVKKVNVDDYFHARL